MIIVLDKAINSFTLSSRALCLCLPLVRSGTGLEMTEINKPGKKLKRVLARLHARCRKCGKPKISLEPTLAESICKQLATAMEYLHLQGIVHRDLKPGNILIKETFDVDAPPERVSVQICDFGLGMLNGDGYGSLISGTPGYMPPEAYALEILKPPIEKKKIQKQKSKNHEAKRQFSIRSEHENETNLLEDAQKHSKALVKLYFDEEPAQSEMPVVRSIKFISEDEARKQGGDVMVELRDELLKKQSNYTKKRNNNTPLGESRRNHASLGRTLSITFEVPRYGVINSTFRSGVAVRKRPAVSLSEDSVMVLHSGDAIEITGECSAIDRPSECMMEIRPRDPTGKERWSKGYVRSKFVAYMNDGFAEECKKPVGTAWGTQPFLASWDVFSYAMLVMEIFTLRFPTAILGSENSVSSIRQVILSRAPDVDAALPEWVPKYLVQLIKKCCARQRKDRPTFAQIVQQLERKDVSEEKTLEVNSSFEWDSEADSPMSYKDKWTDHSEAYQPEATVTANRVPSYQNSDSSPQEKSSDGPVIPDNESKTFDNCDHDDPIKWQPKPVRPEVSSYQHSAQFAAPAPANTPVIPNIESNRLDAIDEQSQIDESVHSQSEDKISFGSLPENKKELPEHMSSQTALPPPNGSDKNEIVTSKDNSVTEVVDEDALSDLDEVSTPEPPLSEAAEIPTSDHAHIVDDQPVDSQHTKAPEVVSSQQISESHQEPEVSSHALDVPHEETDTTAVAKNETPETDTTAVAEKETSIDTEPKSEMDVNEISLPAITQEPKVVSTIASIDEKQRQNQPEDTVDNAPAHDNLELTQEPTLSETAPTPQDGSDRKEKVEVNDTQPNTVLQDPSPELDVAPVSEFPHADGPSSESSAFDEVEEQNTWSAEKEVEQLHEPSVDDVAQNEDTKNNDEKTAVHALDQTAQSDVKQSEDASDDKNNVEAVEQTAQLVEQQPTQSNDDLQEIQAAQQQHNDVVTAPNNEQNLPMESVLAPATTAASHPADIVETETVEEVEKDVATLPNNDQNGSKQPVLASTLTSASAAASHPPKVDETQVETVEKVIDDVVTPPNNDQNQPEKSKSAPAPTAASNPPKVDETQVETVEKVDNDAVTPPNNDQNQPKQSVLAPESTTASQPAATVETKTDVVEKVYDNLETPPNNDQNQPQQAVLAPESTTASHPPKVDDTQLETEKEMELPTSGQSNDLQENRTQQPNVSLQTGSTPKPVPLRAPTGKKTEDLKTKDVMNKINSLMIKRAKTMPARTENKVANLKTKDVMRKINSLLVQRASQRSLQSIGLKKRLSVRKQQNRTAGNSGRPSAELETTANRLKTLKKDHHDRIKHIERLAAQTAQMALSMPSGREFLHSFAKKQHAGSVKNAKSVLLNRAVTKARKEEIQRHMSVKNTKDNATKKQRSR